MPLGTRVEYLATRAEETIEQSFYDTNYPHFLRWRGSVIRRILFQVVLLTLWDLLFVLLLKLASVNLSIPITVVTLLGMVLSLLLVFRTNTAYDRFWEGRRLWSQTVQNLRHLTRYFWVFTPSKTDDDMVEKRSAINLLIAFAVATKHYLRAEYGSNYRDLHYLLNHLPKYNTPTAVEATLDPATNKTHRTRNVDKVHRDIAKTASSNLPLEISIYIQSYVRLLRNRNNIEIPYASAMENALAALMDALTGFERILRTPIPLAYSIHLSQCIWVFCLALPFQLIEPLGYWSLPVAAVTAFTFLGIESIGGEIENPFGYDSNDLPLDEFCRVVRREVEVISGQKLPDLDDWELESVNPKLLPQYMDPDTIRKELSGDRNRPTAQELQRNLGQGGAAGGGHGASGGQDGATGGGDN